jgi:hypothetical protein
VSTLRASARTGRCPARVNDLHQRARQVLAQLSIVAEGKVSYRDPIAQAALTVERTPGLRTRIEQGAPPAGGHASGGSRPPSNVEHIDTNSPAARVPSAYHDLHGHWRARFAHSWDKPEQLYLCVLLAEEALAARHHPGRRGSLNEATESDLLAFRGSPAEAAARFTVPMEYMRTLRERNRQDPETGERWLWPARDERGVLSPEARERLKAEARQVAVEMAAAGESYRRIRDRTGIPMGTLSALLNNPR